MGGMRCYRGRPLKLRHLPELEQARLERTVLELRLDVELTYTAIAKVLAIYEGVELSPDLVRRWCRTLGVAPSPVRVAGARRMHNRQQVAA